MSTRTSLLDSLTKVVDRIHIASETIIHATRRCRQQGETIARVGPLNDERRHQIKEAVKLDKAFTNEVLRKAEIDRRMAADQEISVMIAELATANTELRAATEDLEVGKALMSAAVADKELILAEMQVGAALDNLPNSARVLSL